MKLVSWTEWLDQHIPYYEAERHRKRFATNPPESVLIMTIVDRQIQHVPGPIWSTWDNINERLQAYHGRYSPLFLQSDSHQEYYWAFWDRDEALLALLKLT